jgi:MFS family permease
LDKATRKIAWTSAVIHGLVHASVLLLPPLLGDLQRAFRVSLLDVLAVASVMYLVFGMAALPAGYLADRVGSRTMLIVAAGGCALALLTVAAAGSFPVLAGGLVLLGASAGIYHPSGLSLVSRGVTSVERGRAIGIHGVGGNFGEAVAFTWAGLFAATLGWRTAYAAAAVLAVVCGLLALSLPARHAGFGHGHTHEDGHEIHHHHHLHDVRRPRLGATLRAFWSSRPLRWLLLAIIASGFVYRGVLTFLPLHLAGSAGGALKASYLTSLVLVAGIVAQRLGGELADRLPRERLFLVEVALFVPVLALLALSGGAAMIVMALAFGFLWYLAQPLANALAAAYSDTRDHGLLYGVQFAATFGVGSVATTVGGLLVAWTGGTRLAFLAFGAVAVIQVIAAVALVHNARRFVPAAPLKSPLRAPPPARARGDSF